MSEHTQEQYLEQLQAQYCAVVEYEFHRRGLTQDSPEYPFLRETLSNRRMEKSALFARLRKGGRPLVVPPPLSYSYPFYSAVEAHGPIQVSDVHIRPDLSAFRTVDEKKTVLVQQAMWILKSHTQAGDMIITYPGWNELGFEWRLYQQAIPIADTQIFIADVRPGGDRVTRLEVLKEVALHNARAHAEDLARLSRTPALLPSTPFDIRERQRLQELLNQRLQHGLAPVPSDAEVLERAERELASYADLGIIAGDDGGLLVQQWFLERLSPTALDDGIYLPL